MLDPKDESTPLNAQASKAPLSTRLQFPGVCCLLSVVLFGGGIYYAVIGNTAASTAAEADPSVAFESLGASCLLTGVQHTFRTVRRSTGTNEQAERYDTCEDSRTFAFQHNNESHIEAPISSDRAAIRRSPPGANGNVCVDANHGWDGPWCTGDPSSNNVFGGQTGAHHNPHATRDCPAPAPGNGAGALVACWRPTVPCISHEGGVCPAWYNCGEINCYKVIDPSWELAANADKADMQATMGYFLLFLGFVVLGITLYMARAALM